LVVKTWHKSSVVEEVEPDISVLESFFKTEMVTTRQREGSFDIAKTNFVRRPPKRVEVRVCFVISVLRHKVINAGPCGGAHNPRQKKSSKEL